MDALWDAFAQVQQWLFEGWVQPMMFQVGLAAYLSDAYNGVGWFLAGVIQVTIMLTVIGPMQRLWPVEAQLRDAQTRRDVAVDVLYTLIHRLGVFRIAMFFAIEPLWNAVFGWLAVQGVDGWHLDQAIAGWWPGVTDHPLAGFVAYLIVFDFVDYWFHRSQHQFNWWWALHALHHSQRHLTMWSDNRNHLLDDVIRDSVMVVLARAIGVAPEQFMALVVVGRMLESYSHANVRLGFGWLGERLLVGPRFHRLHHGIGIGHEGQGAGTLGGHNFAVLFPIWDILFGTACYGRAAGPTGIRDQLPENGGRDYGVGFWAQQRLGLMRLFGRA